MQSLKRNQTTAAQARELEDGDLNYLRVEPWFFSDRYWKLLESRRALPVSQIRQEFLDIYHEAQVMVISSDTGVGKSTQIPQFVLFDEWDSAKLVACTQPRRLAASSVARRVADELDVPLGEQVGYSVRFDDQTSALTRLKYMTDGLLLQHAKRDRDLLQYSCIIIDEAHERTLATDQLLFLLKQLLLRRKDLKVIIMSATLDAQKFQSYFNARVMHIPGRAHKVNIGYMQGTTSNYIESACQVAKHIHEEMDKGDILIFLAGEDEIERACKLLNKETNGL
jgi:pre-mRNA-splicing factor ATP-dependent RNA helicase DHX15/PRP43